MKLYSLPLSPFAARVRCAIYAKHLPIEIVEPPADWRQSAAFRALNPLGRIPVLELDDGMTIPESGVIAEYLEDAFPSPSLRPETPEDIARMRLVTQVADLYVAQQAMPLFRLFSTPEPDHAAIEAQIEKLNAGMAPLDALLQAGHYAYGERLTMADCFLTPTRFMLDALIQFSGRTELLDRFRDLAAYADFAQAHPALGRVWREQEDGLRQMMAARQAAG